MKFVIRMLFDDYSTKRTFILYYEDAKFISLQFIVPLYS